MKRQILPGIFGSLYISKGYNSLFQRIDNTKAIFFLMHMHILFLFSFLFTVFSFGAQAQINQNNSDTTITEKHIRIKGTSLFIIPPDSFIVSVTFSGFIENSSGATIAIRKGKDTYINTVGFYSSPNALDQKLKNAKWKFENLKIKKKDAFFVSSENSYEQGNRIEEWILILKDGEGCYVLQGSYPAALADKYSRKVKDSFLSIVSQ